MLEGRGGGAGSRLILSAGALLAGELHLEAAGLLLVALAQLLDVLFAQPGGGRALGGRMVAVGSRDELGGSEAGLMHWQEMVEASAGEAGAVAGGR